MQEILRFEQKHDTAYTNEIPAYSPSSSRENSSTGMMVDRDHHEENREYGMDDMDVSIDGTERDRPSMEWSMKYNMIVDKIESMIQKVSL